MANSAIQSAQFGVATESQRGVVNGTDARNLVFGGYGLNFRNVLINGSMLVNQRGTTTVTAGAEVAVGYTVDRWYALSTGANVAFAQVNGTLSQKVAQFTGAASVSNISFGQRIEAANSWYLAGSNATLAVDLANSLLTTVTWTAYYANSADTFGTRASPTRTQIATGTFTVSSTISRYSTTIAIPAAATTGIEIVLSVGAQTSGTWQIGRASLEAGSVATPFENRPIGVENLLCKRYCHVTSGGMQSAGSPTAAGNWVITMMDIFPVEMRTHPTEVGTGSITVDLANSLGGSVGSGTVSISLWGPLSARLEVVVGATAVAYWRSPSRQRIYSAEL